MAQTASSVIPRRMLLAGFVIGAVIAAIAYGRAQNSLDVVYVPTPDGDREPDARCRRGGPEGLRDRPRLGDGRIAIAAGRRGARALGVELDPDRLREAEANLKRAGVADRVSFRRQNLFETDISQATVLTMYLLPSINLKLRPTILKLRPGTRVVSHDFAMGDWKPDLTETVNWRIHFWVVPAQVAGNWTVVSGDQSFGLTLTQSYQEFRGTATIDGRPMPLRDTKLRGERDRFHRRCRRARNALPRHRDRRHDAGLRRRRSSVVGEAKLATIVRDGRLERRRSDRFLHRILAKLRGLLRLLQRLLPDRQQQVGIVDAMAIADAEFERRRLGLLEQLAQPRLMPAREDCDRPEVGAERAEFPHVGLERTRAECRSRPARSAASCCSTKSRTRVKLPLCIRYDALLSRPLPAPSVPANSRKLLALTPPSERSVRK